MSDEWFYRLPRDPKENGPISFEELRGLGASGSLPKNSLVREGAGAWRVATSMPSLWEASVAVEEPPPPAPEPPPPQPVAPPPAAPVQVAPAVPPPVASPPAPVAPAPEPPVTEPPVPEAPPVTEVSNNLAPARQSTTPLLDSFDLPEVVEDEPEVATSLDDIGFQIVDEAPPAADDTPMSLDDLGLNIVDESSAPAVRSRPALGKDEWNDPSQFRIQPARKPEPEPDDDGLDDADLIDDDLKALAESAMTGSFDSAPSSSTRNESPSAPKPQASKPAAAARSAPTGEYFVKVDGKPHGPITFDQLKGWAQQGRVIEEDEIQLPGTEIWIPAGALPPLFEGVASTLGGAPSPAAPATPAAPPAAAMPAAPGMPAGMVPPGQVPAAPVAGQPIPGQPIPGQPMPGQPIPGQPIPGQPVMPGQPVAAAPMPAAPPTPAPHPAFATPSAAPKRKAKVGKGPSAIGEMISGLVESLKGGGGGGGAEKAKPILIGVGAIGLLYLLWNFMPSFDNDAGTYAELIEVYAAVQSGGAAPPGGQEKVQKIIEELEQTASAKEPEKQRMLWASRDYLLPLLSGGGGQAGDQNHEKFREHMSAARTYFGESAPPVPGAEAPTGGEETK